MVAKIFVIAALALGAIAAPTDASKPFKIGVTIDGKTLYLTKTTKASENAADGITCSIQDKGAVKGVISCDGNTGYYYSELHPLEGALAPLTLEAAKKREESNTMFYAEYIKSNQNWSIGADNVISWKTAKTGPPPTNYNTVHFSRSTSGPANQIFAEICSTYGHPDAKAFVPGVAKAYFV